MYGNQVDHQSIKRTRRLGAIEVKHRIQPVRGICRSWLVQGSDDNIYVLKKPSREQSNLLFNEVLGSELLRFYGLPVARWAELRDPLDSIAAGADAQDPCSAESDERKTYFGSCLIASGGIAGTYQIIPSNWASRVNNAEDFVGVLAIDLWANHCDRRQAIYSHSGENLLKATFIDHGHMFGGPSGNRESSLFAALASDLHIYRDLPIDSLMELWQARIENTSMEDIYGLLRLVPDAWCNQEIVDNAMTQLGRRQQEIRQLLQKIVMKLRQYKAPFLFSDFVSATAPPVRHV